MLKFSLLDIKKTIPIFEDLVECVVLPGEDGQLSVMTFHQPMVLKLKKGIVKAGKKRIAIKEGLAKAEDDKLVVLAEISE